MRGLGGRKPVLPPLGGMDDPDSLYHHMQRYLTHMGVKGQSPHSVASAKASLCRFIRWCEERIPGVIDAEEPVLFLLNDHEGEPCHKGVPGEIVLLEELSGRMRIFKIPEAGEPFVPGYIWGTALWTGKTLNQRLRPRKNG